MLTLATSTSPAATQTFNIVPKPTRIAAMGGVFRLDHRCVIVVEVAAKVEARYLAEALSSLGSLAVLTPAEARCSGPTIQLLLDPSDRGLEREGYRLDVAPSKITLNAASATGLFYGIQTLLQLLPAAIFSKDSIPDASFTIACVEIEDRPRFRWRGAMLDVSRHFMPKEFVLKFIDLLTLHKLNILHLHLTDDQGWRIEIKKYPKLTGVGARRDRTLVGRALQNPGEDNFNPSIEAFQETAHGGYYTQEEAREIVAYAQARHIMVVPEIEMPGHAQAAVAAYPELGCLDQPFDVSPRWGIHQVLFNPLEPTISFLQDVLSEILDIFPSPFIHVGGDEAIKTQWQNSAVCRERMRELGLRDEEEMQSYIIGRMDEFLNARGRRLVGWDEILQGDLPRNAVVMSWRGESGGVSAAGLGHDVIMAPHNRTYLDYYQSEDWSEEPLAFRQTVTLSKIYNYEPISAEIPASLAHHVLGAQAQLWTEYMPTSDQVEYMAFPRLSALAEVLWTPRTSKDYADFLARLEAHLERLKEIGVNYRPLDGPVQKGNLSCGEEFSGVGVRC